MDLVELLFRRLTKAFGAQLLTRFLRGMRVVTHGVLRVMERQKSDTVEDVEMSKVSMLAPQHLMPRKLKGNILVGLCIGSFLFEPPAAPEPTPEADLLPEAPKRGRPKKGSPAVIKAAKGKYGTRQCRSTDAEIRHLQKDLSLKCFPLKPFQRLAVDILGDIVTKHNKELEEGANPMPQFRLSKNALAILQDATEAGIVVSGCFWVVGRGH